MNTTSSKTPKIIGAILGIAVIGGALAWAFGSDEASDAGTATTTPDGASGPATVPAAPGTAAPTQGTYRDGTYSATGAYVSPAGPESVNVSLTVKDDTIVDATFSGNATHPTSKQRQAAFATGYKQLVVGKAIDEVSLTVVNGSSLAPQGFMDALVKIQAEARS